MVLHVFSMGTEILYVGLGFRLLFVFLRCLRDNANDFLAFGNSVSNQRCCLVLGG